MFVQATPSRGQLLKDFNAHVNPVTAIIFAYFLNPRICSLTSSSSYLCVAERPQPYLPTRRHAVFYLFQIYTVLLGESPAAAVFIFLPFTLLRASLQHTFFLLAIRFVSAHREGDLACQVNGGVLTLPFPSQVRI